MAYLDDKNEELQDIYNELRQYTESICYEFTDVKKTWDRILMEEHTIKDLSKKADLKDSLAEGGD